MTSEGSKTLYTLAFNWLLLLSLVTSIRSMALDEGDSLRLKRQSGSLHQACGSRLIDLVSLVCDGIYNPKFDDKRSIGSVLKRGLSRHHSSVDIVRNKRQSIVAECCWNPCTYETLQLYCA